MANHGMRITERRITQNGFAVRRDSVFAALQLLTATPGKALTEVLTRNRQARNGAYHRVATFGLAENDTYREAKGTLAQQYFDPNQPQGKSNQVNVGVTQLTLTALGKDHFFFKTRNPLANVLATSLDLPLAISGVEFKFQTTLKPFGPLVDGKMNTQGYRGVFDLHAIFSWLRIEPLGPNQLPTHFSSRAFSIATPVDRNSFDATLAITAGNNYPDSIRATSGSLFSGSIATSALPSEAHTPYIHVRFTHSDHPDVGWPLTKEIATITRWFDRIRS